MSRGKKLRLPLEFFMGLQATYGVGGASRDSPGLGAKEEGLIWRGGRNIRLPLRFGLRPQGPCRVGQESQASSCLRKGTPLVCRVAQGVSGPSSSCVWNLRVFADDARGWQCPFVLCLHPQGCLRRGVRASDSFQERTGKSGSFCMWHHPRGSSRISS